ncbi:MAG: SDR family oxidoreductase [Fimbriimonadaceae bacterium]|nr:SDR family oxidoreductase [Alphaproteobacteria bacterium]
MKNLFSLDGKVALVTGGSRGIGLMIARGFVEYGAKTYISSRKADVCDVVAAELSEIGTCISVPADLASMDGVKQLASEVAARESVLDILVNNAGAVWAAPIEDFPEAGWDKVMSLNAKSVFFLTQSLLPQLEAAGSPDDPARVINTGSIDGLGIPRLETYSYPASKAAVHQLTRVMASQLAPRHITVNAIAPGPFESQMMAHTLEKYQKQIEQAVPLGRIGRPEDMAGVAIYLASKAGAYVTGTVIPVDGGCLVAPRGF